jgi:hypothetical protein
MRGAESDIARRGVLDPLKQQDIADFDMALRLDPTFAVAYAGRCGAWTARVSMIVRLTAKR